jgi:hypothetical protein
MSKVKPKFDGELRLYRAPECRHPNVPRIYYVNGINTSADEHAAAAVALSKITERGVYGVYNQSAGAGTKLGMAEDLLQCVADWASSATSKMMEWGNLAVNAAVNTARDVASGLGKFVRYHFGNGEAVKDQSDSSKEHFNAAEVFRRTIPEETRVSLMERKLSVYNKATASLFRQLRRHRSGRQFIVAHSQGNLITCDALWAMVIVFGEDSLGKMKVYSLASPAPAWPLGIRGGRRKVYGHTNDLVTFADPHNWPLALKMAAANALFGPAGAVGAAATSNAFGRTAGDWRPYGDNPLPNIKPHDLWLHLDPKALHFANRIRSDLGLPRLV